MKITLLCVGKTDFDFVERGVELYSARVSHYCKFEKIYIPALKKGATLSEVEIKNREGEQILKYIGKSDCYSILLDERGKELRSLELSEKLEKLFLNVGSSKDIFFVIGGAYGFSEKVYSAANELLSLSKMTFSHQIIRVIFMEQLYRCFTIMRGEPYHHE